MEQRQVQNAKNSAFSGHVEVVATSTFFIAKVYSDYYPEKKLMMFGMASVATGGMAYMRYSISDTAEWGDYTAGPKIVTDQTKATMKQLLTDIQSGEFARKWIAENDNGLPNFKALRERDRTHQIEIVGTKLRSMMPFLDPVTLPQPVGV
jgi:ketol-acid reductoisomerase